MAGRRRYDSPWKTIIEALFPEFVQMLVPAAHGEIDWSVPVRFLDKEFARVARGARAGSRAVDRLAEVALRDGGQTWVLVHIEVQAQRDADFARRMYRYHLRIFDHFDREPVSIAVLADPEPAWRPNAFGYERWGCRAGLEYPVAKLTDWAGQVDELRQGSNPFGIAISAHLASLATRGQPESRMQQRLALYRAMRRMGVSQEQASALITFMDWVLELPEELEDRFWSEVREEEGETTMQYMSRFEEKAIERGRLAGRQEGRQEGVALGLKEGRQEGVVLGRRDGLLRAIELGIDLRFGEKALGLMDHIRRVTNVEALQRITDAIKDAQSPEELLRYAAD